MNEKVSGKPGAVQKATTEQIEDIQKDVARLRTDIGLKEPQFAEFRGRGLVITKEVRQGGSVRAIFSLRQTVACDFTVRARFFNLSTSSFASGYAYDIAATRAPVSRDFTLMPISIRIPRDLPPGAYTYYPTLTPINCGVYGPLSPTATDKFTVLKQM